MQALAVLLGLFLLAFAGFAIFNKDPLGGEPVAHIALTATGDAKDEQAQEKAAAPGRRPRPASQAVASKQAPPASRRPSPSSTDRAARATTS